MNINSEQIARLNRFLEVGKTITMKKSTMPILNDILLNGAEVRMSDIENTLVMPIETGVQCTINARELRQILGFKPSEMEFTTLEDNRVQIRYDNRRATLPCRPAEEFPLLPTMRNLAEIGVWSKAALRKMQLYANIFASTDELKPGLTGLFFKSNGNLEVAATNGHILKVDKHMENMDCELKGNAEGTIPSSSLDLLSRFAKEPVTVALDKTGNVPHMTFEFDGMRLVVRLIDEMFPDYESVIPIEIANVALFNRQDMVKLLAEAAVFANKDTHQTEFRVQPEQIVVTAKDRERQTEWQSEIPAASGGVAFPIGLSAEYLSKCLKSIEAENVEMRFNSPINVILLQGVNADFETTLCMPIYLGE